MGVMEFGKASSSHITACCTDFQVLLIVAGRGVITSGTDALVGSVAKWKKVYSKSVCVDVSICVDLVRMWYVRVSLLVSLL